MEKVDGLFRHEKIRVRTYGTDDRVIKLESKLKLGEHQEKTSMRITRPQLEALCRGEYSWLLSSDDPNALYFYRKLASGMLPKSIIQYQRLSFCLDFNNIRITFDSDIRSTECCWDIFQEPLMARPILSSGLVVMEVKFNNFLPGYIQSVLSSVNASPESFSKYAKGRIFCRTMM